MSALRTFPIAETRDLRAPDYRFAVQHSEGAIRIPTEERFDLLWDAIAWAYALVEGGASRAAVYDLTGRSLEWFDARKQKEGSP